MFQPQSTFIYHGFKNKATQSCDIGCFKLLDPCLMIHFNGFASIFLKKIQEIQKNCIFPGLFQDFPGDTKKSRRFQVFQEVWEPCPVSVTFLHSSKYCLCKCYLAQLVKYLTKRFNKNLLSPLNSISINSRNWTSGVWLCKHWQRWWNVWENILVFFSFLDPLCMRHFSIATNPNTVSSFSFFF